MNATTAASAQYEVTPNKLWNVAGIYFEKPSKKYILWTLKLMQDVPSIFGELVWSNTPNDINDIQKFDIIICDREDLLNK